MQFQENGAAFASPGGGHIRQKYTTFVNNIVMKTTPVKPLIASIIGLTLLLPATYFMLTLLVRIVFNSTTLYYAIAPVFLQSAFGVFSFSLSQLILYGPLVAIVMNVLTILQFHLYRNNSKWKLKIFYRSYWLNTAIALQSIIVFVMIMLYLLIEHYRY